MRAAGRVVTRDRIIELVWGEREDQRKQSRRLHSSICAIEGRLPGSTATPAYGTWRRLQHPGRIEIEAA